jgi:regulator of sigma E protease
MLDETKAAKSKFSLSRIIVPALIALVAILWIKGYVNLSTVKYILAFVFILCAAVVLHEFGHFIVAKLFKIRVETFSVGFGPRIVGRKWGTTDYRISAIPLGGYVKLGGDESNAPIEGDGASDIPPEEQFTLRPRWQKFLVAVAGPVMNILTALAIPLIGGLLWGVPITPTSPVVSRVLPDSAAQVAGVQAGDKIVSFNGEDNPAWDEIRGDVLVVEDKPKPRQFVVERNGERIPITITPTVRKVDKETIGEIGILPDYGDVPVVFDSILDGSPAAKAALQSGDRLLAVNGDAIHNRDQATLDIRETKDDQIRLTIERNGKPMDIVSNLDHVNDDQGNKIGRLGVNIGEIIPRQKVGLGGSISYAVHSNIQIMKLTGKALKQFFVGERSARNTLSGPVGIYRAASASADQGWDGIFGMLGFLSLNLGVFNLLPIPVLDGGAIFLLLVEAILALIGMKLSMRVRERIQQVGFVMLLLIMGFAITNDLIKEVSHSPDDNKPPAATAPQK